MNHEFLFRKELGRPVRVVVTGARGGFGRSLLVQCRQVPSITLAALCDLDTAGVMALLGELGFPEDAARICRTAAEVREAVAAGAIVVTAEANLLPGVPADILVESTGQPEASARFARDAIDRGLHVAMVTKETDSVVGPELNRRAVAKGLVYTTADGDQPSNLVGLVTWARTLGFEVVCAGKSSEYDYVFDERRGTVDYTGQVVEATSLRELWDLGSDVAGGIARRSAALSALPQSATPDYCEMNVVANSTGLIPSRDALNYPLCRISELADVFIPREDGGILDRTSVVDVFNNIRRTDEASFGGGVFVIVRCTDAPVWEMLREKGHVVGRSGKYACIYHPYHLMGLETPMTLLSAVLHGRPSGSDRQERHAVMVARAERDFRAGETLHMGGHHHVMTDMTALLLPAVEAVGLAPFYLAANKALRHDVAKGTLLREDAVSLDGSVLQALRNGAA
ncbi:NAD(P)H-dependent oxidoreductase [Roseomonas elaeocarpi]|uniref:NAD(P)H-dependent oxidoreductase n=1 Tax=Roseomonas elaeocarpi TaxID=907779 RepID=A0ABV6JVN1_9PROT